MFCVAFFTLLLPAPLPCSFQFLPFNTFSFYNNNILHTKPISKKGIAKALVQETFASLIFYWFMYSVNSVILLVLLVFWPPIGSLCFPVLGLKCYSLSRARFLFALLGCLLVCLLAAQVVGSGFRFR